MALTHQAFGSFGSSHPLRGNKWEMPGFFK
jgi:hypothetical protein